MKYKLHWIICLVKDAHLWVEGSFCHKGVMTGSYCLLWSCTDHCNSYELEFIQVVRLLLLFCSLFSETSLTFCCPPLFLLPQYWNSWPLVVHSTVTCYFGRFGGVAASLLAPFSLFTVHLNKSLEEWMSFLLWQQPQSKS